jgi:uncharacterized protein with NRDE domain
MCTLLIARGRHPRFPLVIAGNRDEVTSRPSTAPMRLDADEDVWGGQDLLGGGTWLGVARARFFVAVTNQRTHRWPDRTRASRGALVLALLRAHDLDVATAHLSTIPPGTYNEANVLFGTAERLLVAYFRDGAATTFEDVPDGVSVLTNGALGDRAHFPKVARLEQSVAGVWPDGPEALSAMLEAALGDHARPAPSEIAPPPEGSIFTPEMLRALHALCIHTDGYGTVSANVLLFGRDGALATWRHAAGPPCTTPFAPVPFAGGSVG